MLVAEKYANDILERHKYCGYEDIMCSIRSILLNDPNFNDIIRDCNCGISCKECYTEMFKILLQKYPESPAEFKLSKLEYEILKLVKEQGLNYIARDDSGELYAYTKEPIKRDNIWDFGGVCKDMTIANKLFQFIKLGLDEPILIDDILDSYEIIDKK